MQKLLKAWGWTQSAMYIGIGLTLAVAALAALVQVWVSQLLPTITDISHEFDALAILDKLLIVSMLGEIMQMTRISLTQRRLASEPFLVVGLISVVRRIIIITAESNRFMELHREDFTLFMAELVVLGLLLVVMVFGIHKLRQQRLDEYRRLREEERAHHDLHGTEELFSVKG